MGGLGLTDYRRSNEILFKKKFVVMFILEPKISRTDLRGQVSERGHFLILLISLNENLAKYRDLENQRGPFGAIVY